MVGVSNAVDAGTQGVKYVSTGGQWSGLDGGAATQVLTSNGTGVAPSFQPNAGGFGTPTAFNAFSLGATNQTGDGTVATVNFNNAVTQIGAAYDGVNKFTAPATGWYHFDVKVQLTGIVAGMVSGSLFLSTSGPTGTTVYCTQKVDATTQAAPSNFLGMQFSQTIPLNIGNTVQVLAEIDLGAKVVGWQGSGTYFSGYRIA